MGTGLEHADTCETCGGKVTGRWERLTPGLINILVKFKREVLKNRLNLVHINKTDWNHSEKANAQKLRFHALIAKVRVEGNHDRGYWLLTHRGNLFLKGQVQIPRRVFVYRNHVERHDDQLVGFADVMKRLDLPYYQEKDDFLYENRHAEFIF